MHNLKEQWQTKMVFIDIEVDFKSKKILDTGAITGDGLELHSNSVSELLILIRQKEYVCGHNIIKHDLPYIEKAIN
jgi:ATP-dependent DNA helicase RecQ